VGDEAAQLAERKHERKKLKYADRRVRGPLKKKDDILEKRSSGRGC